MFSFTYQQQLDFCGEIRLLLSKSVWLLMFHIDCLHLLHDDTTSLRSGLIVEMLSET